MIAHIQIINPFKKFNKLYLNPFGIFIITYVFTFPIILTLKLILLSACSNNSYMSLITITTLFRFRHLVIKRQPQKKTIPFYPYYLAIHVITIITETYQKKTCIFINHSAYFYLLCQKNIYKARLVILNISTPVLNGKE